MKRFLIALFFLFGTNLLFAESFKDRVLIDHYCNSVRSIPEFEAFTKDSQYNLDELNLLTGKKWKLRRIVNDDIENRILDYIEEKWLIENWDVFFCVIYRDLDEYQEVKNGYLAFCYNYNNRWIFHLYFFD